MVMTQIYTNIQKNKVSPVLYINDEPFETSITVTYLFNVTNGTVTISDERGNSCIIGNPNIGTSLNIELWEDTDANMVAFHYTKSQYDIWIYYDFNINLKKVKITIQGSLPTSITFRLPFTPLTNRKQIKGKRIVFGNVEEWRTSEDDISGITFDWEDVIQDATYNDVTDEWSLTLSGDFTLDPSTYLSSAANSYPFAYLRHCFYAQERYWIFLYDSVTAVGKYKTSTDGTSWSSGYTIPTSSVIERGYQISCWLSGTIVHITETDSNATSSYVRYIRGTLQTDGSISWQTESTVSAVNSGYQNIGVDSNNYVWASKGSFDGSFYSSEQVYKSADTLGTSWGSPTNVISSQNNVIAGQFIPLADGKLYFSWANYTTGAVRREGKYYDGASWDSTAATITSGCTLNHWAESVLLGNTAGNTIHCIYKDNGQNLHHKTWTLAGGWSADSTIQSTSIDTNSRPSAAIDDNNNIHVFWGYSTNLMQKDYTNGSWGEATVKASGELTQPSWTSTSHVEQQDKVSIIWILLTSNNCRFDYADVGQQLTFDITDVSASPISAIRTTNDTIVVTAYFTDPSTLAVTGYKCYLYFIDVSNATIGPYTADVSSIGVGTYSAAYTFDPASTLSLNYYDVKVIVDKKG